MKCSIIVHIGRTVVHGRAVQCECGIPHHVIGGLYKIVTPSSPLSPYLLLTIRWVLLLCYLVQQVVPGRQQYCAVIALSLLIKTQAPDNKPHTTRTGNMLSV